MKRQEMETMKNKSYDVLIKKHENQTIDQAITVDAILCIYLQESNNKPCRKKEDKISLFDIGIRLANNFHYLNYGEKLLGPLTPDKINESLNSSIEEYQDTDFVPSRN